MDKFVFDVKNYTDEELISIKDRAIIELENRKNRKVRELRLKVYNALVEYENAVFNDEEFWTDEYNEFGEEVKVYLSQIRDWFAY